MQNVSAKYVSSDSTKDAPNSFHRVLQAAALRGAQLYFMHVLLQILSVKHQHGPSLSEDLQAREPREALLDLSEICCLWFMHLGRDHDGGRVAQAFSPNGLGQNFTANFRLRPQLKIQ